MAGNISNQTTVFSNVSVDLASGGDLSAQTVRVTAGLTAASVTATGNFSNTTGTVSSGTLTAPFVAATTNLKVGGGTAITSILKGSVSAATITCTANGSSTQTVAIASTTTSDILIVRELASLASGLAVSGFVSAAGVGTLTFSNMSTANQTVAGPLSLLYVAIRS